MLSLTELVSFVRDLAEIVVTILLAYVVYKIAMLIDAFQNKMQEK